MKSHKEILYEELSASDIMRLNSSMKQNIFDAMESAAKQAFEASRDDIENCEVIIDEPDSYFKPKYKTFEDYLKELKNDN